MSASINIIHATVKITSMTDDQRAEVLLKLLESNPAVMIKTLGLSASKLQFMSDSDRMDILLRLLESNPSIVRRAIEEKEKIHAR
jgi:hypothetical protein